MDNLSKLYAGLDPEELREAQAVGRLRRFARDEVIFREGDAGDSMYLLVRGAVTISKTAQPGGVRVLDTTHAGDFFGEMSLIDSEPRSAHASAEEDSELRILGREDLDRLCAISPHIKFNLIKVVSDRLRGMNNQFIERIVTQEKMALVGQMASSIIHDFKSPMTVIRAAADLMALKTGDDMVKTKCEVIVRNVDRITGMANDLLAFALGTVRLNCRWVQPQSWIDNVAELLSPMLERRSVELKREVLVTDPLWMDPDKMMRVIYNLSANAIDAMPGGGTITVRVQKCADGFQLEVADTGQGIPEAIRDRLFGAFVTFGKKHGTGLGTAIAKKIVDEHGGQITFTTATGRGTTFHIRLPVPVVPSQDPPAARVATGTPGARQDLGTATFRHSSPTDALL
jgi:signal transduction histidine kinase